MNSDPRPNARSPRHVAGIFAVATCALALGVPAAASAATGITIASPLDGTTVGGTVAFQAGTVGAPSSVAFTVDGAARQVDHTAPFAYGSDGYLNTKSLSNGIHRLAATAYYGGSSYTTARARVLIDNPNASPPPTVSIQSPATNSSVSGAVGVDVGATGGSGGVSQVKLLVDGAAAGSDASAPYNFTWQAGQTAGAHKITAVATDATGQQGSASVDVTVPASGTQPSWSSIFAASTWWTDFDGDNPTINQPGQPQNPPIAVIDPTTEGVPRDVGTRALRLPMSATDAAAGRIHSKLYKTWNINGATSNRPGMNGNVSGTYSSDFYWPASREMSCNSNSVALMMGWKEIAKSRTVQDSTWWMTAAPACWANSYPHAIWVGPKPADPNAPVMFTRYWNYGRGSNDPVRTIYVMAIPRGRWFNMKAKITDGSSIDWTVDGQSMGRSQNSEYPVGPQYGRASGDQWVYEIGNYGNNNLGTTYVDNLSFTRP
jgi:Big-like domain-containing protein